MADWIRGNDGYAQEADTLFVRYEQRSFDESHEEVLHFMPEAPSLVLDVGSGTGRDAADLAAKGHRVVAVEPTDALRDGAAKLHPSPSIEWIDDGLPDLRHVVKRGECYDLIMVTGVWMHMDAQDRQRAMPVVAAMLRPGGHIIMTLRHGPVPKGRCMFPVSADETIALAQESGLEVMMNLHRGSIQEENRRAGVMWSRLVFQKPMTQG